MIKYTAIRALPLGLLLLAGCAGSGNDAPGDNTQGNNAPVNSATGPNIAKADVTASTPGYIALKNGDYATSTKDFNAANIERPNSAFDELNLGASYQRQGRMDLAEPLYRLAMTHGHNIATTDTTTALSSGHTVEEIACQNLNMGLSPVSTEGTATPCQTALVVSLLVAPGPVATTFRQTSFNTYFEFDKATLTPDGRQVVDAAAKEAISNPAERVTLIGKASLTGTDIYNMALSHRRADAVRDAMIADGVPPGRIDTKWVGDSELPVAEVKGVHEPDNRVVEGTVQ